MSTFRGVFRILMQKHMKGLKNATALEPYSKATHNFNFEQGKVSKYHHGSNYQQITSTWNDPTAEDSSIIVKKRFFLSSEGILLELPEIEAKGWRLRSQQQSQVVVLVSPLLGKRQYLPLATFRPRLAKKRLAKCLPIYYPTSERDSFWAITRWSHNF